MRRNLALLAILAMLLALSGVRAQESSSTAAAEEPVLSSTAAAELPIESSTAAELPVESSTASELLSSTAAAELPMDSSTAAAELPVESSTAVELAVESSTAAAEMAVSSTASELPVESSTAAAEQGVSSTAAAEIAGVSSTAAAELAVESSTAAEPTAVSSTASEIPFDSSTAAGEVAGVSSTAAGEVSVSSSTAAAELPGVSSTAAAELSSTAAAELPGVSSTAAAEMGVSSTAAAEVAGVSSTAAAELPGVSSTAAAELPGVSSTAAAEMAVSSTAPAEVAGVSSTAAAELPGVSSTAAAELPGVSSTAAAETPVASSTAAAELPGVSSSTAAAEIAGVSSTAAAELPGVSSTAAAGMGVISSTAAAPADAAVSSTAAAPADASVSSTAAAPADVAVSSTAAAPVVTVSSTAAAPADASVSSSTAAAPADVAVSSTAAASADASVASSTAAAPAVVAVSSTAAAPAETAVAPADAAVSSTAAATTPVLSSTAAAPAVDASVSSSTAAAPAADVAVSSTAAASTPVLSSTAAAPAVDASVSSSTAAAPAADASVSSTAAAPAAGAVSSTAAAPAAEASVSSTAVAPAAGAAASSTAAAPAADASVSSTAAAPITPNQPVLSSTAAAPAADVAVSSTAAAPASGVAVSSTAAAPAADASVSSSTAGAAVMPPVASSAAPPSVPTVSSTAAAPVIPDQPVLSSTASAPAAGAVSSTAAAPSADAAVSSTAASVPVNPNQPVLSSTAPAPAADAAVSSTASAPVNPNQPVLSSTAAAPAGAAASSTAAAPSAGGAVSSTAAAPAASAASSTAAAVTPNVPVLSSTAAPGQATPSSTAAAPRTASTAGTVPAAGQSSTGAMVTPPQGTVSATSATLPPRGPSGASAQPTGPASATSTGGQVVPPPLMSSGATLPPRQPSPSGVTTPPTLPPPMGPSGAPTMPPPQGPSGAPTLPPPMGPSGATLPPPQGPSGASAPTTPPRPTAGPSPSGPLPPTLTSTGGMLPPPQMPSGATMMPPSPTGASLPPRPDTPSGATLPPLQPSPSGVTAPPTMPPPMGPSGPPTMPPPQGPSGAPTLPPPMGPSGASGPMLPPLSPSGATLPPRMPPSSSGAAPSGPRPIGTMALSVAFTVQQNGTSVANVLPTPGFLPGVSTLIDGEVPTNVAFVMLNARFGNQSTATYRLGLSGAQVPLVSTVTSANIPLVYGVNTIVYVNSVDAAPLTIRVRRVPPPRFPRQDCEERLAAMQTACAGVNVSTLAFPASCSSDCATLFNPFFEQCITGSFLNPDPSIGNARVTYGECQAYRSVASYFPPATVGIASCTELETAVKVPCALPQGVSSLTQEKPVCTATCYPVWLPLADTCFGAVPTNNVNRPNLLALTASCRSDFTASLAGTAPVLLASTGTTAGAVNLAWNAQVFTQKQLRVDNWVVQASTTPSFTTFAKVCGGPASLTSCTPVFAPFRTMYFRLQANNTVSVSSFSAIQSAEAFGLSHPAPTARCVASTFTTVTVAFTPGTLSADTSAYTPLLGWTLLAAVDNGNAASYNPFPGAPATFLTNTLGQVTVPREAQTATFANLTSDSSFFFWVQADAQPYDGYLSVPVTCRTATPLPPPATGGQLPTNIAPVLLGSTFAVSPVVIDTTSGVIPTIAFTGQVQGVSAPIEQVTASFSYMPFTAPAGVSAPITLSITGLITSTNLAAPNASIATVAGSAPLAANLSVFNNMPGVLSLTGFVARDLLGNTLTLTTRAQVLATGVTEAASRVTNSFIVYPNAGCIRREQAVDAACSINVAAGTFLPICPGVDCAAVYNSFHRECYRDATLPPSEVSPRAAADAMLTSCAAFAPLSQFYPANSTCASDEAALVATCGLASISAYSIGAVCPTSCSRAYDAFATRCLAAIPAASPFLGNQAAFLASCKLNFPKAPTDAPVLQAFALQGGVSVRASWRLPSAGLGLNYTVSVSNATTAARSFVVAYNGGAVYADITGLAPNTVYALTVRARNTEGEGPFSAEVTVTTRGSAPPAPTAFTLTQPGSSQMRASWTAPVVGAQDVAVSNYVVCLVLPGTTACTPIANVAVGITSTVLSGLTPGMSYQAAVAARSTNGDVSAYTARATLSTTFLTPATPPIPTIGLVTASSVVVLPTLQADFGSAVSEYRVTLTPTSGTPVTQAVTLTATALALGSLSTTFTGLPAATTYAVSVRAYSATTDLSSAASSSVSVTTRALAPGKVSSPEFSGVSSTGFTVSWAYPSTDGGAAVLAYRMFLSSSADSYAAVRNLDVGLATSYTFANQVSGVSYSVSIIAVNLAGPSEAAVLPTLSLAFAAPSIVSITAQAAANSLSAVFAVGSKVQITMSSDIATAALTTTNPANWLTFTPAVTCPFNGTVTGKLIELTFTSVTGCNGPVIGTSTASLLSAANFVSGTGNSASPASSATSGVLTGRWGLSVVYVNAIANSQRLNEGTTTPLSALFSINFAAIPSSTITVQVTSTIGTVSTNVANFQGVASAFPLASATFTLADLTGGASGVVRVVVLQGSNTVDSAVVSVTSVATNHPITITAPATMSMGPGESRGLFGIGISDPDTEVKPSATATVTLQVQNGNGAASLMLSSLPTPAKDVIVTPGVGVASSQIRLSGTVFAIRSIFDQFMLASTFDINTSGRRSGITITANDNNNGADPSAASGAGSIASAFIGVNVDCSQGAAPSLTSARLSDNLASMVLTFDSGFTLSGTAASDCLNIVDDATRTTLGFSAKCVALSDRTFQFNFAVGTSISVGQAVTLRSNTVSRCAASTTFASGTVNLLAAVNPAQPVVRLSGVSTITPCDDLVVSATTTNAGLRPVTYRWFVASSTGQAVDVSAQTEATLTVAAALLTPGLTYTVSAIATSFTNQRSALASFPVLVSSVPLPGVQLIGDAKRSVQRGSVSDDYFIESRISLSACLPEESRALRYQWSVTPAPTTAPNFPTHTSKLKLDLATLVDDTEYTFKLLTKSKFSTDASLGVETLIKLTVTPAPLTIVSTGASTREVSIADPFSLAVVASDATANTFTWTCVTAASSLPCSSNGLPLAYPNAATFSLAAGALSPDAYLFTAVASKATRQSPALSFRITVVPTQPPQVSVSCPNSAISNDAALAIAPSITGRFAGSTLTTTWTAFASSIGAVASLSQSTSSFVVNQDRQLNFFRSGLTYTFTLRVTETFGASTTATSVSCEVPIKSIPSGGMFTVTPSTGVALSTLFKLEASLWQTSTSGLTYSFYTVKDGVRGFITGELAATSFATQLAGKTNGTLTVGVRVSDANGEFTTSESVIHFVAPAQPLSLTDIGNVFTSTFGAATNTGDQDSQIQAINNVATASNDAVAADPAQQKALADKLMTATASVAANASPNQVVNTVNTITADPTDVSQTSALLGSKMLQDGFGRAQASAEQLQTGARSTATVDADMAGKTIGAVLRSGQTTVTTPTSRRLLATTTTNDRTTTLAAFTTMRSLLTMQSQLALSAAGSFWQSDMTAPMVQSVKRFSTSTVAELTLPGASTDVIQVSSTRTAAADVADMDARYMLAQPNPFNWHTSADVLIPGSPSITVEITSPKGELLGDASTLSPLTQYSYIIKDHYDNTAAGCPIATCVPMCKLFDPASNTYVQGDVVTTYDAATGTVQCKSSTPGSMGFTKTARANPLPTVTPSSTGAAPTNVGSSTGESAGNIGGGVPIAVDRDESSLSGGAVAGIVIAVIVVFVAIVIGLGLYFKKQNQPAAKLQDSSAAGRGQSAGVQMAPINPNAPSAGHLQVPGQAGPQASPISGPSGVHPQSPSLAPDHSIPVSPAQAAQYDEDVQHIVIRDVGAHIPEENEGGHAHHVDVNYDAHAH